MADDRLNLAQVLSDAAKVDRLNNRLFCLGPNVGRINFLSQQIRALNLIWALNEQGIIQPNQKVAVIGAGFAGVTAAVALRAYRCSVKIYDEGGVPLHRQRLATHRFVFPNINWWPHEDGELAVTTALPFLDWHLGRCSHVVEALDEDWKRLKDDSKDDLEFIPNVRIERVDRDERSEGRLVLSAQGKQLPDLFDAVIVASGFGEERSHLRLPTPSYWRADDLESVRIGVNPKLPAIISGFGDGGQIDALRLAYDFRWGELSFCVASTIQGTPLQDKVAQAEDDDSPYTYGELAREIIEQPDCQPVRDLLDAALHKEPGMVIMVDNALNSPFESGAAPIHKLLVAFAHERRTISYRKAQITKAKGIGKSAYDVGGQIYDSKENHIVIRHGASTNRDPKLIHPREWETLASNQGTSKNWSYKKAWDEVDRPFAVPDGWPCRHRDKRRYIAERAKRAQRAISNMGSSGRVIASIDRFIVVDHDREFSPSTLFGIRVDYDTQKARSRKSARAMD